MFGQFTKAGTKTRFFSAEGAAGGGGGGDPAAAAAAGAQAAAGSSWFEDQRISAEGRDWMAAKGLTKAADPLDAVTALIGIGQAADRRFGRPLDAVIDKPGEGQSLAEWRRANAEVFGLPAEASAYEINRPADLPEGIAWNDGLADKMRSLAYDRGLAPDDVQAMTSMYAGYVAEVNQTLDQEMRQAEQALDAELLKHWGKDSEANKTRARQAASALAEQAGLDADGIRSIVGLLSSGDPGQTAALRMFAALGEMLAEDKGIGLRAGAGGFGPTKAEAEAEFARFMAADSEWAKASAARDSEAIARLRPQFERLAKAAAGAK